MDYPNNTIAPRKHKHLSFQEYMTIQIRLKDAYSAYNMGKKLGRTSNTIRNEIAHRNEPQIKQDKLVNMYLADTGISVYSEHYKNYCPKYKRLLYNSFIEYVCTQTMRHNESIDACFEKTLSDRRSPC